MAQAVEKITYTATPEQIERMHSAFDEALAEAEKSLGQSFPILINGEWKSSSDTFPAPSPIDHHKILGNFVKGTTADVDAAVAAAKAAYPAWSSRPWQERVAIMRRAAEIIRERKFLLSALLIIECGKNRAEAIGEVEEGADLIDEYALAMEQNKGFVRPMGTLDPRENNTSILRPFGVWGVMAPFNFPNALSAGPASAAMVAGNTVVYKPASATPRAGYELAVCFVDAGVPAGVFNFLTGSGATVGEGIALHPDVDGVIFTGSKEVGFDLFKRFSTDYPKPIITEMGGKNPTIVTANADLDKAVDGVARSAFGFSGQKCSACSRVYVERPVYDDFIAKLTAKTDSLKVGDPAERDVYVGPVVDKAAVERFEGAVASARGGTVRSGGERLTDGDYANGTFVQPTVIDGLPADHDLFKRELFLPLVVVAPVDSLDEALKLANDTEYGLTAGIFSEDKGEIETFFNTIEAGVVYANRRGGATTRGMAGMPVILRLERQRQHG